MGISQFESIVNSTMEMLNRREQGIKKFALKNLKKAYENNEWVYKFKVKEILKNMKRKQKLTILSIILTLLIIVSIFVVGCSSNSYQAPSIKEENRIDSIAPEKGDYDSSINGIDSFENVIESNNQNTLNKHIERKFIENGSLELRSKNVDETFTALSNLAKSLDGRVVSYDQDKGDSFKTIRMQVAVPYGKLNDFMEHAGESATKIESQSVTSEEVTEEYHDTKTRIESIENLIKHYRDLLNEAKTIEDILQVQTRIDDLTYQLEALKGKLKVLDYLTQESFISIVIRMEEDPIITKPEVTLKTLKWSDVGYLMKTGLHKVGIIIALGFQYFLIFLVYASPLILLAIIIRIIFIIRKKKMKNKPSAGKITSKRKKQKIDKENMNILEENIIEENN
jgi:hypothetical protein